MKNIPLFVNNQSFQIYLDEIKQYYETLKSQIENLQNDLNTKINKFKAESNTNEHTESIFDEICEQYKMNEDTVKRYFRYSVVIQIYTLIEDRLNNICDFLCKQNQKQISYQDLSGNGSYRALNYLKKVFSISLGKPDEDFINSTNTIRNAIAHTNGNLTEESDEITKKIKKIVNKEKGISIDTNNRLDISDTYISYLFENTRNVFNNIYKKI